MKPVVLKAETGYNRIKKGAAAAIISDGEYLNALWYCFAVETTIGFGNMTAVSVIGRVLSVIPGMYGIAAALITSIIVNFCGEMKKPGPRTNLKRVRRMVL